MYQAFDRVPATVPAQSLRARAAASAADIAAVDRGEGRRLFCYHRALYGQYPRRFMAYILDVTAASWSSVSGNRTSP